MIEKAAIRDLKTSARGSLHGHYQTLAIASVIYLIITGIARSFFLSALTGNMIRYSFFEFILALVFSLFHAGFSKMWLCVAREEPIELRDLFHGFKHHPDKFLMISIYLSILSVLCTLPAMAASFVVLRMENRMASLIISIGLLLLSMALNLFVQITCSSAYFICCDRPSMRAIDMMKEAYRLIRNNRLRYFKLLLSFIGYGVLILFSFGIALLWVSSYFGVTSAFFYRDLLKQDRQRRNSSAETK